MLASNRGALHSFLGDNVRFVVDDAVRQQSFAQFLRFPPANNNSLLDTVKVIERARLRWLGHLFRMQELEPCRRLLKQKALNVCENLV